MTSIKTADLIGPALDYAVRILVEKVDIGQPDNVPVWQEFLIMRESGDLFLMPSTEWEEGGPIIEREISDIMISQAKGDPEGKVHAYINSLRKNEVCCWGPTILIAAMRCYVTSKLGDEIDVPKELM